MFTHLAKVEANTKDATAPYEEYLNLITTIPGVNTVSDTVILVKIGTDMGQFSKSQHFCSWAGLSPGNYKSTDKQKVALINQGNAL